MRERLKFPAPWLWEMPDQVEIKLKADEKLISPVCSESVESLNYLLQIYCFF